MEAFQLPMSSGSCWANVTKSFWPFAPTTEQCSKSRLVDDYGGLHSAIYCWKENIMWTSINQVVYRDDMLGFEHCSSEHARACWGLAPPLLVASCHVLANFSRGGVHWSERNQSPSPAMILPYRLAIYKWGGLKDLGITSLTAMELLNSTTIVVYTPMFLRSAIKCAFSFAAIESENTYPCISEITQGRLNFYKQTQ